MKAIVLGVALIAFVVLAGCTSNLDKPSKTTSYDSKENPELSQKEASWEDLVLSEMTDFAVCEFYEENMQDSLDKNNLEAYEVGQDFYQDYGCQEIEMPDCKDLKSILEKRGKVKFLVRATEEGLKDHINTGTYVSTYRFYQEHGCEEGLEIPELHKMCLGFAIQIDKMEENEVPKSISAPAVQKYHELCWD